MAGVGKAFAVGQGSCCSLVPVGGYARTISCHRWRCAAASQELTAGFDAGAVSAAGNVGPRRAAIHRVAGFIWQASFSVIISGMQRTMPTGPSRHDSCRRDD